MMKWHQPVLKLAEKPKKFPWWVCIIIFVFAFCICFGFIFFNKVEEGNISSLIDFVTYLFFVPFIMALAITFFVNCYYEIIIFEYLVVDRFLESKKIAWKNWVNQGLYVINSSYITPVADNAVKIMGLNDQAQANSKRVLKIEYIDDSSQSRLIKIVEQLLTPMRNDLIKKRFYLNIEIYSTHPKELTMNALSIFCNKNDFAINIDEQVNILSQEPDLNLINNWIDDKKTEHLILSLNLHYEDNVDYSEFATALLLSGSPKKQKEVYPKIHRMLETDLSHIEFDFALLLDSEQTDNQRIRHIWGVNMNDSGINTIITEIAERNLPMEVNNLHRLDIYEGVVTSSHCLLAIAYACEAIKHGQKAQIVGSQNQDNIHLMQLDQIDKQDIDGINERINYFPFNYFISIFLFFIGLCFLSQDLAIRKLSLIFTLIGGFLVAILLYLVFSIKRGFIISKLEQDWSDEMDDD
ncbi:hypothetical protein RCS94_07035 [Orbaceae bacterium ac157xtp]